MTRSCTSLQGEPRGKCYGVFGSNNFFFQAFWALFPALSRYCKTFNLRNVSVMNSSVMALRETPRAPLCRGVPMGMVVSHLLSWSPISQMWPCEGLIKYLVTKPVGHACITLFCIFVIRGATLLFFYLLSGQKLFSNNINLKIFLFKMLKKTLSNLKLTFPNLR